MSARVTDDLGLVVEHGGRQVLRSDLRADGSCLLLGDHGDVAVPLLEDQEPVPTSGRPPRVLRVTGVVSRDEGTVVFATDSDEGHQVEVRTAPDAGGARIEVRALVPAGAEPVTGVALSFDSPEQEAFHGFGGRREGTDLRGSAFHTWTQEYRFPDVSTSYYWVQASFVSSEGYAVLLDRDELAHWSLGAAGTQTWRVAVRGDALDLVVWPGEPAEAMAALTAVTGRHRVAPEWAMQPTLSRATLVAQDTAETYAEKVRDDLEQLDRRGLPVGCYAFEGWEVLPSEQVRETVQRLKAAGRHALLYLRSFVSDDTALTEPPARFGEALEHRVVATGEDGEPYLFPSSFGGQSAVVDFTAGHARDWWTGRVQALMATGAEGFMCDFGEQVVVQMRFADGTSGERAHNAYPRWQHAATRAAAPEAFVYVRAGYSGRPGSAAYESATFPGDESNDWTSATGLPSIVPDMLNRAVGGAYGFTTDIGGYADFALDPQTQRLQETDAELFLRWSQAAVFTPFFRVHNGCLTGLKLPWSYDDDTERLWAEAARLHVRAVPLIRRLWAEAVQTGMPPTRPLWLVDDAAGRGPHADSQWLLGEDVVVAPVLERGATSRAAWLPPGSWQWQGSGPEVAGGREVVVDAPVDTLPWWTRSGTSPLAPEDAG